jgi:hypothetical protein
VIPINKGKQAANANIVTPIVIITAMRINMEDVVSSNGVDAHPSTSLWNLWHITNDE